MNFELFTPEPENNLLPYDGVVQDYGIILTPTQSEQYLQHFLNQLPWQADEVFLFGRRHITERKVVWYGDDDYQYHYSGMAKQAHIWNPALYRLKQHIEQLTGQTYNSCLANLYENGSQGVGWHSDDEPSLEAPNHNVVIASLSLGATRKFSFKHKWKAKKVDLLLHSGQLIVMKGQTQRYWKHTLAKSTRILAPRVNLTFRYFYPSG